MKNKTIVCLISQQNIPNYLFIKELFEIGDRILLITSQKFSQSANYLKDTLGWTNAEIETKEFEEYGDEDNWDSLNKQIKSILPHDGYYIVNLTGGTKMMSLSVYLYLGKYNKSEFYYIPFEQNYIQKIGINQCTSQNISINHNLGVEEYFSLYGRKIINSSTTIRNASETNFLFQTFTSNSLSNESYECLRILRLMRGRRSDLGDDKALRNNYNQLERNKEIDINNIPHLYRLMQELHFSPNNNSTITKKEIEYLTGGWFEEWSYNAVKDKFKLKDSQILLGGHIDEANGSELDVAFTLHNKLYIIECKSGIERLANLKDYLQKANSIKANIGALSAESVIFGLACDDDSWHDAAKYLKLSYLSKNDLINEETRFSFIKER